METSFCETPEFICTFFSVNKYKGLDNHQVLTNRIKYGRNELPRDPPTPLYKLILEQFSDQLVIILLLAAFISFVLAFFDESPMEGSLLTAFIEPIVILLILIANATVGVVQETNAEKAIEALKSYTPDEAKVIRNGELSKIHSEDLVPGDIVEVSVGDKIPADLRVIEIKSSTLRMDQALLTGESLSVTKDTRSIKDSKAVKQDQINILFSGTTVTFGHAISVVVKTGLHTAIGEIQRNISEQVNEKTPLKKRLDDFGDSLAKVISVICILVWLINIRHFSDSGHGGWMKGAIYYFKIAVALAVAAIPEGLAVIITTCLALGTKRMAKKNAIVRSLPSVETLGCTSVICSDKTGTLTTNKMSVSRFALVLDEKGSLEEYAVTGTSFSPIGNISSLRHKTLLRDGLVDQPTAMIELATICSLCNESSIHYSPSSNNNNGSDDHASFSCLGEPTEAALKVLSEKMGTTNAKINKEISQQSMSERANAASRFWNESWETLATLDFDRDRKSMSVYCQSKTQSLGKGESSRMIMLVKGAPESILDRCSFVKLASVGGVEKIVRLNDTIRVQIYDLVQYYGKSHALRVLGFAVIEKPPALSSFNLTRPENFIKYEQNMTFIGLAAMSDPPRPEVKFSVQKCKEAGIRVVVITGDNQATAEAICRQIGVFGNDEDLSNGYKSITGREFDDMKPAEQLKAVLSASLFSRTDPIHKCKLVDLLKMSGAIVAMTGDGVNDAPALKKADIGIAMGSGTDVAKLAADMVLADDNFATIVEAVEEGRSIYNNTKQFIRYLISSNIGEVVSIFLTVLLGMPEALIPVQLLWVNLVTDGLPATALGFNPADHEVMKHGPRSSTEPIVTRWLFFRYCVIGLYVGAATVFGYAWWFLYHNEGPQITFAQLRNFHKCATLSKVSGSLFSNVDCSIFDPSSFAAKKATTMSLSILVTIEMFNAMNSLSENESLLTMPLWRNMSLVFAIMLSMMLHFVILYVPFFSGIFEIIPLSWTEWQAVVIISIPVIFLDEILKTLSRQTLYRREKKSLAKRIDH